MMGFVKEVSYHMCERPMRTRYILSNGENTKHGPGSIWECDECGKFWILTEEENGGWMWKPHEELYTPTTEQIREAFIRDDGGSAHLAAATFDRWLAKHDRGVAEAAKLEARRDTLEEAQSLIPVGVAEHDKMYDALMAISRLK